MGHDDEHEDLHRDGKVPLYCRPVQRQKWGEAQIQPHTNWGDTFFDLFYVAGAYNLGNLIRAEPTSRGLLYFCGCFFSIQVIWNSKMYYDARIWVPEDIYHRLYEFAILVNLATAVLHIRPVSILADSKNNIDVFVFSLSLSIASLLSIGRSVELYFKGVGQPALKTAARRDIQWFMLIFGFNLVAAVKSGMDYFRNLDSSTQDYDKASYETDSGYEYEMNQTTTTDYDGRRILAPPIRTAGSASYETDVPISLVLASAMSFIVGMAILVLTLPGGGKHKEIMVPMNINFAIHRWGEFTMLMLGETVLSLLIVDVTETSDYYKTLFCGIISITLLEYLHFRSQPHDAEDHALRRSKEAGATFTILMQIYSAALVVLGTSFKMLLYEYVFADSEIGSYRLLKSVITRLLADDDEPVFTGEERRQRTADFFCGSMAIVWFCSDLMILNHRGLIDEDGSCRFTHTGTRKVLSTSLLLLRIGLIAYIATLSQYVTDPAWLAFTGMAGIMVQVILRVMGTAVFGAEFAYDEDSKNDSSLWPNVTRPRVEEEFSRE